MTGRAALVRPPRGRDVDRVEHKRRRPVDVRGERVREPRLVERLGDDTKPGYLDGEGDRCGV